MKEYNICLSCDNNYAQYAGVVIASILLNSDDKSFFNFYILDGNIEQENKDKIEKLKEIKNFNLNFISIDENLFEVYKKIGTHSYISLSAYYRLKLASLLPKIDKVLYLDCDVIVSSDLTELFETDISEYYAAGVKDIAVNSSGYVPKLEKGNIYFNSGVLYFNLDKIRKDNIESEFEKYTIENFDKIRVGDQEIINVVCQGKIKELYSTWNVQSSNFVNRSDYTKNPNIVHYVGRNKPWKFGSINYWKNLYFNVLEKTPWAIPSEEINKWTKENQKQSIINYLKYRPLFFLRPRFYKALIKTYL
ncbi:glycosyltransferase family 8 protein [bacterium]|nr:glycosyltransferase family 8 protein [bacterium]